MPKRTGSVVTTVPNKRRKGVTPSPPPECVLNKDLHTIPKLLEGWYVSTPGYIAVTELDRLYKKKWRRDEGSRRLYFRRKRVIELIDQVREKTGLTRYQVGNLFEYYRLKKEHTVSDFYRNKKISDSVILSDIQELAKDDNIKERLLELGLDFEPNTVYEASANGNSKDGGLSLLSHYDEEGEEVYYVESDTYD